MSSGFAVGTELPILDGHVKQRRIAACRMFIAKPVCEAPVMAALGRNDSRYFWAVELSIRLPWFIVNTVVSEGKDRHLWSVCCAWEKDAAALCEPAPGREVVSIQQIVPSEDVVGGWHVRQIVKVWLAPHPNGMDYVVLQDDRGEEFSGEFGAAPPAELGERRLVFTLDTRKRRGGVRRRNPKEPLGHNLPLHPRAAELTSKVTAEELAAFMGGIDVDGIANLEGLGALFHVVDEKVSPEPRYPLYQVWPTIPRQIFVDVLKILRTVEDSSSPHFFFAYQDPDLGSLTPIEVLLGALLVERELHRDAPMLLAANAEDRQQYVLAAARIYANTAAI